MCISHFLPDMLTNRKSAFVALLTLALLTICATYAEAQETTLTLRHAVELAQKKSASAVIADTDQKIAENSVEQIRGLFLPQVNVGAGIGYSRGFPLTLEGSAPSLFNLNSQQSVLNTSLLSSMRAAKSDAKAAAMNADEKKSQIALDTCLVYLELVKLTMSHQSLVQLEGAAARVEKVSQERFSAGVDSQADLSRARLISARARLALVQEQGKTDALRQRLAQLAGLSMGQIVVDAKSVPALPESAQDDDVAAKAVATSNSLKSLQEHTVALELRAQAEHRAMLPTFDFAAQYAVLANYQHYQDYFARPFMRNNVTAGVVIRLPIFNFAQKARAETADLESLRAKKEVEVAKQQVSNETLRLKNSVRQLAAARDVARLEAEVATADADAMVTRMESSQATQRDLESARLVEVQKKAALIDAQFELDQVRLQLMQATGGLGTWFNSGPQ